MRSVSGGSSYTTSIFIPLGVYMLSESSPVSLSTRHIVSASGRGFCSEIAGRCGGWIYPVSRSIPNPQTRDRVLARRALIHRVESKERRGRVVGSLAVLLSIAVLGSTWVGLFAFLGGSAANGTFQDVKSEWIPETEEMDLTLPQLSAVSRIYAGSGEMLAQLHDGRNSKPVEYEEIPQVLVDAVLAAEDDDFFEHDGWDPEATAAAMRDTLQGTLRGGSTVTQQVVKNAFVGSDITLKRKVNELFVSLEVEREFSKEDILGYYLNSVYFGAGAYGVKAAAEEFYDKDLEDITLAEAATLAVMIRNPGIYNPRQNPEDVRARRDNTVLADMEDSGWISAAERKAAADTRLGVVEQEDEDVAVSNHVVAAARSELLSNPEFSFLGETLADRKRMIFGCPANDTECSGGGGLTIETTVDMELQEDAQDILADWFPLFDYNERIDACTESLGEGESSEFIAEYVENQTCQVTGALSMVDNETGAIKVMASAIPFEFNQFDLALQARRNPGSSFKPFALVAALQSGITLGTRYDGSSPQSFTCEGPCSPSGNQWTVRNAGSSYGNITLEQATYNSVNTVYAQVGLEVGPSKVADAARSMGIRSPLTEVPSIVLGTSAVTTLEMASAFSNFATNGVWAEPYLISKITDRDGTILYEKQVQPKQTIDPAIAAAARRPLLVVPVSGTGPKANIGRPQGGKTGTHQNFTDAWFVGFTPEYSTAVWVGNSNAQEPMTGVTINGETYSRVYGGDVGAPIWAEFMTIATEGMPEEDFPDEPEDIGEFVRPPLTTVPNVVGLDSGSAAAELEAAGLNASISEAPSREPEGIVVGQEYAGGAQVEEGTTVTITVSNGEVPSGSMPDLVGLTQDEALAVLGDFQNNAGIRIEVFGREVPVDEPNQVGIVLAQTPSAGAAVNEGDRVVLDIGVGPGNDDGDDGDNG
ncbi:MAG: PASTA domain-containing protein, partial [Acidimicrobiia bacterium]|nr:PASTA domain-containing protein [Acidimicrobiia bacterium]